MIQFSKEKLDKVQELISRYPQGKQKSALLPVLHLAQQEFGGWLDVSTMDYVASLMQLQPIEVYEDIMEAEIVKAIVDDSETWHTFNDNALNATFGPQQTAVSDGGYDGIAIPLVVTYRVVEGDPYTAR